MMKSEQINELSAALAKAQGEMEGAKKDSTNPHFKSKYADIASVWEACRAALSKHGLSVIQTLDDDDKGPYLLTTLCHASGQWLSSKCGLILVKNDMQGLGSAITYARRYSLAAICGVAQEDDDGEAAVDRSGRQGEPVSMPAVNRAVPRPKAAGPVQAEAQPGSNHSCENCGTELVRGQASYYCPNYKDKTKGDHSRVPYPRVQQ